MPQSDGKSALKRMTIYDPNNKSTFNFTLNPQEYLETRPHRVTVVKTMSDIVIEDFNSDIPTLKISGHTGWKHGEGKKQFDKLERLLRTYANRKTNYGSFSGEPLYFYNYTDDKHYRVHITPEGYTFKRSAEKPLLFDYELNFYIVSNTATYKNPKDMEISNKDVTTGDKNATKTDTYKKDDKKPAKKKPAKKPANYQGNTTNIPKEDRGQDKSNTQKSVIQNVDANTGYPYSSLLSTTGIGSTRLAQSLGVQR